MRYLIVGDNNSHMVLVGNGNIAYLVNASGPTVVARIYRPKPGSRKQANKSKMKLTYRKLGRASTPTP